MNKFLIRYLDGGSLRLLHTDSEATARECAKHISLGFRGVRIEVWLADKIVVSYRDGHILN